jgi:hypothetical protein
MACMLGCIGSGRLRLASISVALIVVGAACAQSNGDSVPTPSSLRFDTIPERTVDSTTDIENATTDAATTDGTDGSIPATDPPPTSIEPTTPPPSVTLPATTTTEPIAVQELLLRGDGIGSAVFGAAPDGVIDYVSSILGGNTGDTGWVEPFTFAACEGTTVRRVDWGVLSLLFGDLSKVANGREHFLAWEYGRVGELGDEPVGLRSPGGTTLGSRIVDLLAEFPDASVNAGEEDLNSPPNFYVSDSFRGLLTGVSDDDLVTVIFGGRGCGE